VREATPFGVQPKGGVDRFDGREEGREGRSWKGCGGEGWVLAGSYGKDHTDLHGERGVENRLGREPTERMVEYADGGWVRCTRNTAIKGRPV